MEKLQEFLKTLFPNLNGEYIEIRAIGSNGQKPEQKFHLNIEELILDFEWRKEKNLTHNIYFGVATRKYQSGKKEAVAYSNAIWIDFDNKDEAINTIRKIDLTHNPTIQIKSGNGIHCYWLLKEPFEFTDGTAITKFEKVLKNVAIRLGGDTKVCDASHVMRLPYTKNVKNPDLPLETTVISFNPEYKYNLSDFDIFTPEFIEDGTPKEDKTETNEITSNTTIIKRNYIRPLIMKPCVEKYEKEGVQKGIRNRVGFLLACEYCHLGISIDEAKEKLINWNVLNKPPFNEKEFRNDLLEPVEKAYKRPKIFGCNHKLLETKCVDKDKCEYFKSFSTPQTINVEGHDENLFYEYGYEKLLSGLEVKVYKAIVKLEEIKEVKVGVKVGTGGTVITSMREITNLLDFCYEPIEISRALYKLHKLGLINFTAGDNFRGGNGSIIYRIIPIPEPITKNISKPIYTNNPSIVGTDKDSVSYI